MWQRINDVVSNMHTMQWAYLAGSVLFVLLLVVLAGKFSWVLSKFCTIGITIILFFFFIVLAYQQGRSDALQTVNDATADTLLVEYKISDYQLDFVFLALLITLFALYVLIKIFEAGKKKKQTG